MRRNPATYIENRHTFSDNVLCNKIMRSSVEPAGFVNTRQLFCTNIIYLAPHRYVVTPYQAYCTHIAVIYAKLQAMFFSTTVP
jgi:hypothetical protein